MLSSLAFETCACCGRQSFFGPMVYVQGAFNCAPCARGEHRHARKAA
jgi:hypothetical protein